MSKLEFRDNRRGEGQTRIKTLLNWKQRNYPNVLTFTSEQYPSLNNSNSVNPFQYITWAPLGAALRYFILIWPPIYHLILYTLLCIIKWIGALTLKRGKCQNFRKLVFFLFFFSENDLYRIRSLDSRKVASKFPRRIYNI